MKHVAPVFLSGLFLVAAVGLLLAQPQSPPSIPSPFPAANPHAGDREAIRNGMSLFRSRCGDCHGLE